MIRRYTRAEYVARTAALSRAVPGLTLSTDVIVGFPGETEEDFAETLSLVRAVGFRGLFGFKYSERPYTPSRKLADDVSDAVKSDRLSRLFALSEALLGDHLATLVGTTQLVLIEGVAEARFAGDALWSGRTDRNEIVHVARAADRALAGEVVEVAVVRHNKHSLQGELTEAARAAAPVTRSRPPETRAARRSLPVAQGG
jgi:tRNA-2-methylthio-N6-dimethylallyladenosine synthase